MQTVVSRIDETRALMLTEDGQHAPLLHALGVE